MKTFLRIALIGLFLLLMKEGFRLVSAVLFLLDPASSFSIPYGLFLGVSACSLSVVCVGMVFKRPQLSTKYASLLVCAATLLAVVAALPPSFCNGLSMQTQVIELLGCQRLLRLATGFGLLAIVVTGLWFLEREG